jgi:hypothetical protein
MQQYDLHLRFLGASSSGWVSLVHYSDGWMKGMATVDLL